MPIVIEISQLAFDDELLGVLDLPRQPMRLTRGIGSGLSADPHEPSRIWAIGDRGPNLNLKVARERYGAAIDAAPEGAKVMPCPEIGPALVELRWADGRIEAVRTLSIGGGRGAAIGGLPIPAGEHAASEPAVDMSGAPLGTDPAGADTEGVIALPDGGFWVGDEYGPSLLRLDAGGRILARWVPEGCASQYAGAGYPIEERLPAIAGRRHINRGFEAIALSPDGRHLHLAFQSPLAHPDAAAHEQASHVRLWTLDASTGTLLAQHLYPLDPPERFRRDCAEGDFAAADVKFSELAATADGRLICLERGSATTKLYVVSLSGVAPLPAEHLDPDYRPTVEQLSAAGTLELPVLPKQLLLDTDAHPAIGRDLEGIALLGPDELVLVSDNDFGVEGAATGLWRIRFDAPI